MLCEEHTGLATVDLIILTVAHHLPSVKPPIVGVVAPIMAASSRLVFLVFFLRAFLGAVVFVPVFFFVFSIFLFYSDPLSNSAWYVTSPFRVGVSGT